MVTYFNRKDLVKFGNYLLSDERTGLILDHPISYEYPEGVQDRLKQVSHADVENFLESIKKVD